MYYNRDKPLKVISYHNGEEFMRGEVIWFTDHIAVVKNEANGFLNTLSINSLKVIEEEE